MIKSKKIDSFFSKRKVCDEDEKRNAFTLTKLEKFNKNQKFKTI